MYVKITYVITYLLVLYLSHFLSSNIKLYCTYRINGYISKITISKLTVNGQLPGDAPHPSRQNSVNFSINVCIYMCNNVTIIQVQILNDIYIIIL